MPKNCDKSQLSKWCCNTDVKLVQLRSRTAGNEGTNEYKGKKVFMCKECRKANNGTFKIVKN